MGVSSPSKGWAGPPGGRGRTLAALGVAMYPGRRWLVVPAAVLLVGTVEALSDTVFDAFLPFPFHALLVLAVVAAVGGTGAWEAFRRIDRLTRDLRERNAALESRNAVLRAVYDVSLSVSGQADPDRKSGG